MSEYRKFIGAFLLAVASAIVAVGTDGIDSVEIVNAVVAGIGAVYVLISGTAVIYKAVAAALSAGLVVLSSVLSDGITSAEWYQIVFAAFAVLVAAFVPNSAPTTRRPVEAA